jgi:hypothetical protein
MTVITFQPPIDPHVFPPGAAVERLERLLRDPALSKAEKRSTLSGWASDAHAVEDRPWLRQIPESTEQLPLAAILSALRRLDDDDPPPRGGAVIRLPRYESDSSEAEPPQPNRFDRSARRSHGRAQRSNQLRSIALSGLRRRNAYGPSRAAASRQCGRV